MKKFLIEVMTIEKSTSSVSYNFFQNHNFLRKWNHVKIIGKLFTFILMHFNALITNITMKIIVNDIFNLEPLFLSLYFLSSQSFSLFSPSIPVAAISSIFLFLYLFIFWCLNQSFNFLEKLSILNTNLSIPKSHVAVSK